MREIVLFLTMISIIGCQSKIGKKNSEIKRQIEKTKTFPKLKKVRYNVAFLIMDGTFNTELIAPFDIFQHTIFRKKKKLQVKFSSRKRIF